MPLTFRRELFDPRNDNRHPPFLLSRSPRTACAPPSPRRGEGWGEGPATTAVQSCTSHGLTHGCLPVRRCRGSRMGLAWHPRRDCALPRDRSPAAWACGPSPRPSPRRGEGDGLPACGDCSTIKRPLNACRHQAARPPWLSRSRHAQSEMLLALAAPSCRTLSSPPSHPPSPVRRLRHVRAGRRRGSRRLLVH